MLTTAYECTVFAENFPVALLHIDGPMADRLLAQSDEKFAIDLGDRYAASGLYAQVWSTCCLLSPCLAFSCFVPIFICLAFPLWAMGEPCSCIASSRGALSICIDIFI